MTSRKSISHPEKGGDIAVIAGACETARETA